MSFARQQLRSFVDRVCRLNDEIKTLNGDKSEVYKEAKGNGFNPKVLKAAVKRFEQLRTDRHGVEEFDALFDMYMHALLGVSDDQEGDETPPAASAGLAKGIVKASTRARTSNLPPHDEDGVIIELPPAEPVRPSADIQGSGPPSEENGPLLNNVPGNGPATAPAPGAEGLSLKGDAGETTGEATPHMLAASSINSDPHGVASEEGADAIALDAPSSQLNPEAKATEVEPGNAGGIEVPVRLNNDREGVASRLAGGRTPAGEGAEPSGDDAPHHVPQSGAPLTPDAPGSSPGPVPVETPGALNTSDPYAPQARDGRLTEKETGDPVGSGAASAGFLIAGKSPDPSHQFPCEANGWAGLEPLPQFDRRRPAA